MTNTTTNVLTGGPCAGKSSVLSYLSMQGYTTLPEAARLYLDQCISEGKDPSKVALEDSFEPEIDKRAYQIEKQIPDGETCFLDRTVVDGLAYRRSLPQYDYPEETSNRVIDAQEWARNRYDNIFLLELVSFDSDGVRRENSKEEAKEMEEKIREEYQKLGYEVIDVPLMDVAKRGERIVGEVEHPPPIH